MTAGERQQGAGITAGERQQGAGLPSARHECRSLFVKRGDRTWPSSTRKFQCSHRVDPARAESFSAAGPLNSNWQR